MSNILSKTLKSQLCGSLLVFELQLACNAFHGVLSRWTRNWHHFFCHSLHHICCDGGGPLYLWGPLWPAFPYHLLNCSRKNTAKSEARKVCRALPKCNLKTNGYISRGYRGNTLFHFIIMISTQVLPDISPLRWLRNKSDGPFAALRIFLATQDFYHPLAASTAAKWRAGQWQTEAV